VLKSAKLIIQKSNKIALKALNYLQNAKSLAGYVIRRATLGKPDSSVLATGLKSFVDCKRLRALSISFI